MATKEEEITSLIENSFIAPFVKTNSITDVRFDGTTLRVKDRIKGTFKAPIQPTQEEVETFIRQVSNINGKAITDTEPILDTQLGIFRVNAIHKAASPFGMTMALRISRPRQAMSHLSEVATEDVEELLKLLVLSGISMTISGMTGSGKTEVQKMLVSYIDNETISLIEDTMDSHMKVLYPDKDINSWRILDGEDRIKKYTGSDFIRAGLRNDSDWIIISETRGSEEAYEMVQAALTGHSTLTTLHTKKAAAIPNRILNLVAQKYRINEILFGKDIVSSIPIGFHMTEDTNEDGETIWYIREIVEFADFNENGVVYYPIYEVKNVLNNEGKYEMVKETFPISDRLKGLFLEKKLIHLLPDSFK